MSDSVSNLEIEDVLSSIRKLVSNDNRESETEPDSVAQTQDVPRDEEQSQSVDESADKLVLSQSQRIVKNEQELFEQTDTPTMREAEPSDSALKNENASSDENGAIDLSDYKTDDNVSSLRDKIARLEAAVGREDGTFEADAEDDVKANTNDPLALHTPIENDAAVLDETDIGDAAEDQNLVADDIESDVHDHVAAESQQIVQDMLNETDDSADVTPDEDVDPAGASESSDEIDASIQALIEEDHIEVSEADHSTDADISADDLQPELVAGATLAGFKSSRSQDLSDGDALEKAELADLPTSPDGDDPVEDAQISENDADDNVFETMLETAELDEETMRNMIRDVVREELQGALGERITRNVRRLVRREIQRALSTQEFS